MRHHFIIVALMMVVCGSIKAELAPNANLSIEAGSHFSLELEPGVWTEIAITGFNGIHLGITQTATSSSTFGDDPDIDQPWLYQEIVGMHASFIPITVLTDDSAGNVTLDFSRWTINRGFRYIGVHNGLTGIANVTCAIDCSHGDTYTLSYQTIVEANNDGFPEVNYRLTLTGTVKEVFASPLPAHTLLTLETGNNVDGSFTMCTIGSCMAYDVSPFYIWGKIGPGTDGGIVIGKNQGSGGQNLTYDIIATPGEMTNAFRFFWENSLATLFTGMGQDNVFDEQSCVEGDCYWKVLIQSLDLAWNSVAAPLGNDPMSTQRRNGGKVRTWDITLDGNGGGSYFLDYTSVMPITTIVGTPVRVVARGKVLIPQSSTTILAEPNVLTPWMPGLTDVTPNIKYSCAMAARPSNGTATVNPDCSVGNYQSDESYIGMDSFSYTITNQEGQAHLAVVEVVVETLPGSCIDLYPLRQVTAIGSGQSMNTNSTLTTIFTGHITTETGLTSGGKNVVKICPGTAVNYETVSTVGSASCIINSAATASTGKLAAGDKLICTNKPDGNDVDRFSIKSGI